MRVVSCCCLSESLEVIGGNVRVFDFKETGGNSSFIVYGSNDAVGVDFLYSENSIFWMDINHTHIRQARLSDPKNVTTILNISVTGYDEPVGLACDWLARNLYWTNGDSRRIEVSNLDGRFRKVLFWNGLYKPRAIAVDPNNGLVHV